MEKQVNQGGIDKLAAALSKFQGEVLNAHKSKQGYNYNYADLAAVLDIARPLLAKNGLSVVQMPATGSQGNIGLQTTLMHESGQSITGFYEMPLIGSASMTLAQAAGSTITYMRRYALAAALGIAQDDNDAAAQIAGRASQDFSNDALAKIAAATTAEEVENLMKSLDEKSAAKIRPIAAAKFKALQGAK